MKKRKVGGIFPKLLLRDFAYSENCKRQGFLGEVSVVGFLRQYGFRVRHLSAENPSSAWDIAILDEQDHIKVLIENKDCTEAKGTRIDKKSKMAKLAIAESLNCQLILTTVTVPKGICREIRWAKDLRNMRVVDFDPNTNTLKELIADEIGDKNNGNS